MIKRPPVKRDPRKESSQLESEKSELKRGLELAIDQSISSIHDKISAIIQQRIAHE